MTPTIEGAVAHYHELLNDGHWQATYELVTQGGKERQLRSYGKPIASCLRPYFMEPAAYASLQRAASLVQRAVVTLGQRIIEDAALRRRLRLTPEEDERVTLESNPVEPYARLDGFTGRDGVVRFLEYNSIPAGPHLMHRIGQLFDELPIMAEFRKRYRTHFIETEQRFVPSCIRAHHQRGGTGLPNVGVVASGGAFSSDINQVWSEHIFMMQAAMEANLAVRLLEPESVEYRNGRLYSGDFAIDCITYLDYPDFLRAFPMSHPLWRAIREGSSYFLGSFALTTARGNKALFALLTDPEIVETLEPEVREAVVRHVPWTRVVEESRTEYGGAGNQVDLLPFIAKHRDRFALKPTNVEGGKGVVLGWQCDAGTWETALSRALESAHVVQERIYPGRATYPSVHEGKLVLTERNEDCNPFLWNENEVEGCFIRLSASEMLNLQQDGTLAPLFLVSAE
ncbi:hypothetical protein LVJ94_07690 [Pendulispora rubella]|uniref:Circularly permuted type 2 ATP-grasp protein n=1 Tax=Pendulispora rubella TaxID=2741070 RepID=A0ABZ2L8M3_9BACT